MSIKCTLAVNLVLICIDNRKQLFLDFTVKFGVVVVAESRPQHFL